MNTSNNMAVLLDFTNKNLTDNDLKQKQTAARVRYEHNF